MRSPCDAEDVGSQGDLYVGVIAAAVAALRGDEPLPGPGGRLPEYLRELYTQGGCEELADAMHETTGWPVVVVGDRGGVVGWVHAGVEVPSGEILDAAGRHSPEEWPESWGSGSMLTERA